MNKKELTKVANKFDLYYNKILGKKMNSNTQGTLSKEQILFVGFN